ncbi:MAG: hydrogenase formation protein HypD [Bacteroidales bacterium]|nr:hydrogenase formation protein HypD [Bacteroidales bacterium]
MRFVDEYRDIKTVEILAEKIKSVVTKDWTIMEICGGQTHSIMKYRLQDFLPEKITLVHGPGCPVCVTPLDIIDKAHFIASCENVIFCSFGDMLRVPGSETDLLKIKAEGGDVRIVYSPLDAVKIAKENPDKKIVFLAVGFETTAPANAMAVLQAKKMNLSNFSILSSHVLVPPAMHAILSSDESKIQGFLAAGHVCTVMGYEEYIPVAEQYKTPIVVTGFEPVDILKGILSCVKQLENNEYFVENEYKRFVKKEGNIPAKKTMFEVFEITDKTWRGIGEIAQSGLRIKDVYKEFDAERLFNLEKINKEEPTVCIAGEIMQGLKKPFECPAFGKTCKPENPLGSPMVSSEGACAAYYRYNKLKV